MDHLTRHDLQQLVQHEGPVKTSIYMPTFRAGREVRQNAIRFKNLVKEAASRLIDHGLSSGDAEAYLEGAWKLEADGDWWQHQADGLAVFLAGQDLLHFRLPVEVDEVCVVGPRFHLAPLAPLMQDDGRFYILAVSQNRVRLLLGSKFSVSELEPQQLPGDLRSALNIDEYVSSLQHHSAGVGRGDAGQALFHGHGGSDLDVQKQDEILQFFRRVDSGLQAYLRQENTPLVFAGVEYLFPLFQEACHYRSLVEEPVTGNPDQTSAEELHRSAWPVVGPYFDRHRKQAVERYAAAAPADATSDPVQVVQTAREGQVGTLLYAEGARIPGTIDTGGNVAAGGSSDDPTTDDLVNAAVVHTLANGGEVFALPPDEMPSGKTLAATLRYPLPLPLQ